MTSKPSRTCEQLIRDAVARIGGASPRLDAELLLTGAGELQFFARRPVSAGDELLASYSTEYWTSRGIAPV